MKYLIAIFLGCCSVMTTSNAMAQMNIGPLMLDPSFANNGTSEIDFEGFNDDATCFAINLALNRILIAGKIYTSTPGVIRFGVAEYDANGISASGFGSGGKADLIWDSVDYPMAIDLLPDGGVLAAGASAGDKGHFIPTMFRIKANGTPDSSFGTNGRVPINSVIPPMGEFENLDTLRLANMAFRVVSMGVENNGADNKGFYSVRFDSTGSLDSAFGQKGQVLVKAPISSAQGHLVDGDTILFVGLSDLGTYPEILLCKLLPNGTPDSSFGTNGVLNTGITLHGGDQLQSIYDPPNPSDTSAGLLVAAPLADSLAMLPFTNIKFKLDGTLDSNYGQNGIATTPVISSMKIYGMTPPNGRGYTHLCGGIGNVSATVQFLPNGVIDSTFGTNGIALMDADGGLRKNFLIGFTPASSKHFVGIGTSVNTAGNDDFLVARYIPGIAGVAPVRSDNSSAMQLYPNPVHGFIQVEVPNDPIEQISIVDALGRIIESFERPSYAANSNSYFLDVSEIPNGAYTCIIRTSTGTVAGPFSVVR